MSVVFVAVPSELAGGSGVRVLNVLPLMRSMLIKSGIQCNLYIPCYSSLLIALGTYITEPSYDPERVFKHIMRSIKEHSLMDIIPKELLDATYQVLDRYVPKLADRLYRSKVSNLNRLLFLIKRDEVIRDVESLCLSSFLKSLSYVSDNYLIHAMHESYEAVYASMVLSKQLNGYGSVLLQIEPFCKQREILRNIGLFGLTHALRTAILSRKSRNLYLEYLRSGRLRLILGVSLAPIIISGIDAYARRYGANVYVLKPGNAIDPLALKYRSFSKELLAVFWARLCKEKGVFDLLRIWKVISGAIPEAELIVAGRFIDDRTKRLFFKTIQELNLRNVKYLGYVKNKEDLYKVISKAKVLIYPSYSDAFPLVVLEALALGVSVVAYDIPAITSVYGNLPAVKVVRRGDVKSMASSVLDILKLRDEDYVKLHENEVMNEFIRRHTSWEEVARNELSYVLRIIEGKYDVT